MQVRRWLPGGALLAAAALLGVPASPAAAQQPVTWNFQQADVNGAQAAGRDGSGVTVAVVDTWIDSSHPAFGGRVLSGADCIGGTCRPGVVQPDACTHGTHVAGTVASSNYGVAPQARILPVQVLAYDPSNGDCSGSTADVANGIRWAAAYGAQVINLSLGGAIPGLSQSSDITAAVHDAAAAGIVVVFAAGNQTVPLTDNYGSDALIVAATGPSGGVASYSQRGSGVALAAPGGDTGLVGLSGCTTSNCILSTFPDNQYGLDEGTSMAAPHVSGLAALLIAQNPARGRASVVAAMESTARPLAGGGHGLIDAAAALARETPAGGAGGAATSTSGTAAAGRAGGPGASGSAGPVTSTFAAAPPPLTPPPTPPPTAAPASPTASGSPSPPAAAGGPTGSAQPLRQAGAGSGGAGLVPAAAVAAFLIAAVAGAAGATGYSQSRRRNVK